MAYNKEKWYDMRHLPPLPGKRLVKDLPHLSGKLYIKERLIWYTYLTYLGRVIHKGEIVMRYLPYLPGKRLVKDLPHMWRLTKKGEVDTR